MNTTDTITPSAPSTSRTRRRFGALVLIAGLGIAACGSDEAASDAGGSSEATVSIADPWSREPADGQTNSAVYGVVTNSGEDDITAIAASTSVADTVELHQVTMNDEGQMSMSEKEGGYTIAAGESFTFEPGGPHIMLLGIDPATYPDTVDVTLEFDNGSTLDFTADVRAIDADEMGDMDEMEMDGEMDGEMEMDDDG